MPYFDPWAPYWEPVWQYSHRFWPTDYQVEIIMFPVWVFVILFGLTFAKQSFQWRSDFKWEEWYTVPDELPK